MDMDREKLLLLSKEELVDMVVSFQKQNEKEGEKDNNEKEKGDQKNTTTTPTPNNNNNNNNSNNNNNKSNNKDKKDKKKKKKAKGREIDWGKYGVRHVALMVAYIGSGFHGMAHQQCTENTIEGHIINGLIQAKLIKDLDSCNFARCGRTDKGVSAFEQVVTVEVRSNLKNVKGEGEEGEGEEILGLVRGPIVGEGVGKSQEEFNYPRILNSILPHEIRVVAWSPISKTFSPRFDCVNRTYKYFFYGGNLDIERMRTAGQMLVGEHDFRNFCKPDVQNVTNFRRRVLSFSIERLSGPEKKKEKEEGEEGGENDCMFGDMYSFTICGYAFLWHQVRCMVAVLFMVGRRDEDPGVVELLLDVEKTPRKPSYEMASELPLVLFRCSFAEDALTWQCDPHVHSSVSHTLWEKQYVTNMIRGTIGWAMWGEMRGFEVELLRKKEEEKGEKEVVVWRDYPEELKPRRERKHTPLMKRQAEPSLEERVESMSTRKRKRFEEKFGKDGKGRKERKEEEEKEEEGKGKEKEEEDKGKAMVVDE